MNSKPDIQKYVLTGDMSKGVVTGQHILDCRIKKVSTKFFYPVLFLWIARDKNIDAIFVSLVYLTFNTENYIKSENPDYFFNEHK